MTKRKTSTAGKRPSRTIKDRARRIIEDERAYDVDTRKAIARALANDPPAELAELVARAEAGEIILDLTGVEAEQAEAATATYRLLESDGLPEFVRGAVLTALHAAGDRVSLGINDPEDADEISPSRVAALYNLTQYPFDLNFEPTKDAPELLSAVLRHDGVPEDIKQAIREAMCQIHEDVSDPRYLALILEAAQRAEEKGAE